MSEYNSDKCISGIFITFPGTCKKALTFYQNCFGGTLQFETFDEELQGFPEVLVVSGSLVSERITIHGSDLVHNEGRKLGNYISVFLKCQNIYERKGLIKKLEMDKTNSFAEDYGQTLIEITDAFDVRWILAI